MTEMPWRSIRFRLTCAYTAILAATFATLGVGTWLTLRHSIENTADAELRSRLPSTRSFVEMQTSTGGVAHLIRELSEDAEASGLYLRIVDLQGNWIYRSPTAAPWLFTVPERSTLPERGRATTFRSGGEEFRTLSAPLAIGTLQLGISLREFNEMLRDFAWSMGVASPLLLLSTALGGYWMSGRALRPVARIAASANRISAANLSERLPFRENGDELDRLSATLNGMLERLELAFARTAQFTADASHELRTPIAIMRTAAELIRSRPRSSEELDKAWSIIVAQTERTSQLIDDLLVLARADSGTGGLIFEKTGLTRIATETCNEIALVAKSADLHLSLPALPDVYVSADAAALRRVFLILLDNAIQFTPAGGSISLNIRRKKSDPLTVEIEITDSGIGIPAADLPFIFERFYRASKDRSRKTGGAGLGLSIAKWIVTAHSGEICVRSAPGAGSTFTVFLPLMSEA